MQANEKQKWLPKIIYYNYGIAKSVTKFLETFRLCRHHWRTVMPIYGNFQFKIKQL